MTEIKTLEFEDGFKIDLNIQEIKDLNSNERYSCFNGHKEEGKYFCWAILPINAEYLAPEKERVKNATQFEIAEIMYQRFILKSQKTVNASEQSFEGMVLSAYDLISLDENFDFIFWRRTNC